LLKYLSISKDIGSEIWKNQETASEQSQLPKPLIEQLQASVRFHQIGPVQERHQQIKQIKRSFEELGQMNNNLYELVGTQEASVRSIKQKGEEVVQTIESTNAKLEKSTQSARSRQSIKKWC
jgi:chromosome segregation ATPase